MNRVFAIRCGLQVNAALSLLVDNVVGLGFLGLHVDVQVGDLGQLVDGVLPILLHVRLNGSQVELLTVELQNKLLVDLSHGVTSCWNRKLSAARMLHSAANNIAN